MALAGTGAGLGDKIAKLIISPDAPGEQRKKITELWESIGETIVAHLVSNIELDVNAVIAVSTSGTETAQTGQTTAKGTGKIKFISISSRTLDKYHVSNFFVYNPL